MARLSEMEFTIRPVRGGDAPALSRFYQALSEKSRWFFEPWPDISESGMQEVVQWACEGRDISLVTVTPEDGIIAHLFLVHVDHEIPHGGIGILDAYQGCGLGRFFLKHLMHIARRDLGKEKLGLTVMKENIHACRLYTALGFEIIAESTFRAEHDSLEMHVDLQKGEMT